MAEAQNNGGTEINGAAELNGGAKAVTFSAFKPQLVVEAPKAVDAVAFYKAAFGAEEVSRVMHSKRKAEQELPLVLSADLKLCSSIFSVSDFAEDSTLAKNEGAVVFTLETDDIDGAVSKATTAGAVAEGEISEVEGGARVAKLKDPFGYLWTISSSAKAPPTVVSEDVQA
ncbi:hypothetical protein RND81_02G017500 [Saponaria officinalis]|uniref:VOC domain-containing protein n=1 Tax=Saponaria officinalis TaxID=3572 RepID=A0AAW1MSS1_SAPOF